jgi:NTP pyrophosphatase (non-canonical NTP hydrolase)
LSRTYRARWQAMSKNDEIADLLEENKKAIDFLTVTYNEHKELLDQHKLTEELEQLLACVHCFCSASEHRLIASMQEDVHAAQLPRQFRGRETWSKTARPESGVESKRS